MKKIISVSLALALAACSGAADDDADADAGTELAEDDMSAGEGVLEGEEPGFEAVAPGTYEVTRSGGEVDMIEIHEGMTFSRIAADGTATGGSIFMKDGKTCFLAEGQETENCFTDEPQPDGSMQTTAADGSVATVRPVEGSLEDNLEDETA